MRVGLTGGVASGKSTVSAMLAELGAVVIDSDALAREVVLPGRPAWPPSSRPSDPRSSARTARWTAPRWARSCSATRRSERCSRAILHPLIGARSAALAESAGPDDLVIHDIPLLAEAGIADSFDAVIVVDAPVELQVERMLRDRGWTQEDAESRIAAQAGREDRLAIATYVVENTGSLEDLRARVREVYDDLTSDAEAG